MTYNHHLLEQRAAERMLNALEENNAPFLPKEDGRLSPYAIYDANTGKVLQANGLLAMQLIQASEPNVYKTPRRNNLNL